MRKLALFLILAGLSHAGLLLAGDEPSWDNLNRSGSGERIDVVDMKMRKLQGTFAGFTEEAISLKTGADEMTVPRAEVLRVTSRERTSRGKNVHIGLQAGALLGLIVGAYLLPPRGGEPVNGSPSKAAAVFGAFIGGGAGAAIGAAFPGYKTIYRAKKP